MMIPPSELASLPAADREEFLATLKSSGTQARLKSIQLETYLGAADPLPGVIFGYRVGRADSSIAAEVWYFETYAALTKAHAGLIAAPKSAITSNGSFLVRFTASHPGAAQALSECVQAIAGEE
ncbi:MAG TPA: hypothetical protein VH083_25690 [Myxococcales bacterium]|jgi:hypothetical protein|nr:hypothetical protein [Myxococcales bacterium]